MEGNNPNPTAPTGGTPAPGGAPAPGGEPAGFTPILTQADFDAAIAPRLERERRTAIKPYSDYESIKADLAAARTATAALRDQLTAANEKIKGYEADSAKTRIALEAGLPYGMAARLNGTTEEEIRADAKALADMLGANTPAPPQTTPPLANTEPPAPGENATLLNFLKSLKGE